MASAGVDTIFFQTICDFFPTLW